MNMNTLTAALLAATLAMAPVAAFADPNHAGGLPALTDRVVVLESYDHSGGGVDGIDGINGVDGINGINGVDGQDGADGFDNSAALLAEQQARIVADENEELARIQGDLDEAAARLADIQEARDARDAAAVALAEGQAVQDENIGGNTTNIENNTTNISNFQNYGSTRDREQDAQLADHETRITNNSNDINRLGSDIDTLRKGIAGIAAVSSIHYDTDYIGIQVGAGVGYFDGEEAVAVGVGGALSDQWFVNANVFTNNGHDSTGGGVGFTFKFQ